MTTGINKRRKCYGTNSNKAPSPYVRISSCKRNRPPNCSNNKRQISSAFRLNETKNAPKLKQSDMLNFYNNKKPPERPRNQRRELHRPRLLTNKPKQMLSSRPFSSTSRSPRWKQPTPQD